MTISLRRVLGVTLGLIVTGAVCGAILGAFTAVVHLAAAPPPASLADWPISATFGAAFGALFGSVLSPLVAWVFLRRVTFAHAITRTALGIVVGTVFGAVLAPRFTVLAGVAGFVGAAIWLWVTTSARLSASMSPPDTER